MSTNYWKLVRVPRKLELGQDYRIWQSNRYGGQFNIIVRLIKPTPCGYNFLDLKTSKCVFKHHLYPSKCPNHIGKNETWFFINRDIVIEKYSESSLKFQTNQLS